MPTTIRDVAKRAGVSISTVSRVLNNTAAVNEGKRERVMEAVRALDYVPNPAARSLLGQDTGGIGVLLPYVAGEYFSEFLTGMDYVAKDHGKFLLISTSHHETKEWQAAVRTVNRRVDGLLVMAPQRTPRQLNLDSWAPTVFVNTPVDPDTNAEFLNFDDHGGSAKAARHLVGLGHRHLAYVQGPEAAFDASERLRGFADTVRGAGGRLTVIKGGFEQRDGFRAAEAIGTMRDRPTAVGCANDYATLGLLSGLQQQGIAVPEDISLVGFDDLSPARFSNPALTTVNVPIRETGIRAIELVIRRALDGPTDRPVQEVIPLDLIVRASTAPPVKV
ncbi:MAG: LacI family DNA-binding transcriptional regulator [Rhodothermales bacterium]|nr:LacI family DNA-binding transcriptional regulator [Rhodothermales bacterium]MBO6780018.1 LacI family DNA-binding transcriptional regulator [Rhodothermales bacterium]